MRSGNALCDPNKHFPWRLPSAHQDPAAAPSLYSLSRPISFNPTRTRCATASSGICENLEQFGGAPAKGEPDPRAIWDRDEALAGLDTILDNVVDEIAPDGIRR